MIKLRLKSEFDDEYYSDVEKIISVFAERGYEIDYQTAKTAWMKYSESMAAGWMRVDDYAFYNLQSYLIEDEK